MATDYKELLEDALNLFNDLESTGSEMCSVRVCPECLGGQDRLGYICHTEDCRVKKMMVRIRDILDKWDYERVKDDLALDSPTCDLCEHEMSMALSCSHCKEHLLHNAPNSPIEVWEVTEGGKGHLYLTCPTIADVPLEKPKVRDGKLVWRGDICERCLKRWDVEHG